MEDGESTGGTEVVMGVTVVTFSSLAYSLGV